MYKIVIKLIISQNISFHISQTSKNNIFSKFIKNIQTNIKTSHVDISKMGYIFDTFCLQYLHFHIFFSHENIGINSKIHKLCQHFEQ